MNDNTNHGGGRYCVYAQMACPWPGNTSIAQELYTALGWEGGTIHQVLEEIMRLKAIERSAISDSKMITATIEQDCELGKKSEKVSVLINRLGE